jgi:UDP-glucose 4-epimerase
MIDSTLLPSYKDRKAVVLGGCGFIGREIVSRLLSLGSHVTVGVLHPEKAAKLGISASAVELVRTDIRDFKLMQRVVQGADYLFSFAGISGAVRSGRNPQENLSVNGLGILNVLEACRLVNPNVRVVFPSSRLVYGKPDYLPVDEEHPLHPNSFYGIHKLLGEMYHKIYFDRYNLRTVVLRISNVYGPDIISDNLDYNVVNKFAYMALAGKELEIFGEGSQLRDYLYVRDVAEAVLIAACNRITIGKIYNLGSGQPISFTEMITTIVEMAGRGEVVHRPWPKQAYAVETGDFYMTVDKFKDVTGWEPAYSLKAGVKEMLLLLQR